METIQAIRSRRSIRKYQPKPVPHEVIEQIVADAAYAPLVEEYADRALCARRGPHDDRQNGGGDGA